MKSELIGHYAFTFGTADTATKIGQIVAVDLDPNLSPPVWFLLILQDDGTLMVRTHNQVVVA